MRRLLLPLLCAVLIAAPGAVWGQAWAAASTAGITGVKWFLADDRYGFVLNVPEAPGRAYSVLAWTLQPFNIAAPTEVVCPEGWVWHDEGKWKSFEIADQSQRYVVGGPALEPGEELTLIYTVGTGSIPVNPGGPGGGDAPAFISHLAAVDGQEDGRWVAVTTEHGETWFDAPSVEQSSAPVPSTPAAEPSGFAVLFLSFCPLASLAFRRTRV